MSVYKGKDRISLLELAAKELVNAISKDGVLSPVGIVALFRLHELAGYPIESKYIIFDEENYEDEPIGLKVREVGAYLDLLKIAKFYGINQKSFYDTVVENPLNYLSLDFSDESKVIFRINRQYGVEHIDALLESYASCHNLKNLKKLLNQLKRE